MTRRGCPREVEQLYDELSSLHSSLAQQHLDYINDAILDGEQQTFQSSFMEEPNEEFEAVGVEVCEYLLHREEKSLSHSSKRSSQSRRSSNSTRSSIAQQLDESEWLERKESIRLNLAIEDREQELVNRRCSSCSRSRTGQNDRGLRRREVSSRTREEGTRE